MIQWWLGLIIGIGALILGAIGGFFIAVRYIKKYQEKNPPINEDMVRAMMRQMGRTPSQKQVRQVMESMKQAQNKK